MHRSEHGDPFLRRRTRQEAMDKKVHGTRRVNLAENGPVVVWSRERKAF